MSSVVVTIKIEEASGVDAEGLQKHFDDAVQELPESLIASIGGGWEVDVREI